MVGEGNLKYLNVPHSRKNFKNDVSLSYAPVLARYHQHYKNTITKLYYNSLQIQKFSSSFGSRLHNMCCL